ncbi:MAG: biopolymer transport protein ExbD [Sulfurospirillum sp.]|jgi:biopolymer transport protein ExbD|nr:biopolymer transport protein ExbD [Sulfurospirillum sp.]DAB34637.1 MAG TPA: biopolymer transporter ExbD [Sulfurospirillum sp. UBA12182]
MYDWDESPDLNITPLVDIMLVLLAILMVTTPALIYEEKITLPDGTKTKVIQKIPEIEIRITKDRDVYIKQDKFSINEFPDNFIMYAQKFSTDKTIVYIKADEVLSYKDVMFVLKSVKEAGFINVSLETNG